MEIMNPKHYMCRPSTIGGLFLVTVFILSGCSGIELPDGVAEEPVPAYPATGTRSILLPTSATTVHLSADGVTDTHELISSKGFNPGEDPYYYPANHYGVKHISQIFDPTLGKYVFRFDIHIDHDVDKEGTTTTKQRVELKTDSSSPENMRGELNDTHIYKWKFKLPLGMQVSKQFCYIHQLKTIGGDDSHPVIAMRLGQVTNTPDRFQLIHVGEPEEGNKFTYLANVNMSEMLGEWVEVTERATYRDDGAYECLIVRLSDNKVLVDVRVDDIDLWRTPQCEMVRPKYGIYRGIEGDVKSELRDETLLFADFELTEIKNVQPTVSLIADGVTDTHTLISSKGFDPGDDPYYFAGNHSGVKHITQAYDDILGKYVFKFDIHIDQDRDRNSTADSRQRVEMKTSDISPANMRGEYGDTHIYSFKFKLPEGMQVSQQYCYIHQLNPVGGRHQPVADHDGSPKGYQQSGQIPARPYRGTRDGQQIYIPGTGGPERDGRPLGRSDTEGSICG